MCEARQPVRQGPQPIVIRLPTVLAEGEHPRPVNLREAVDEVRLMRQVQLQLASVADPPHLGAAIRKQAADQGADLGGVAAGADRVGEPRLRGGDHQGIVEVDHQREARGLIDDLDDPAGLAQPPTVMSEAVPGQIGDRWIRAKQLQTQRVAGGVVGAGAARGGLAVLHLERRLEECAHEYGRILSDPSGAQVPQGCRIGRHDR